LLTTGNLFCMACPFTLPRAVAKRWLPAGYRWPRRFRSKWLAVALLAVFFWAYEALSLWNSPWLTAWIAIAYFLLAFTVDGFFRDASFCKYLCPIGQFNFVQSLMAPLEVRVTNQATCLSCKTRDCIRGNDVVDGCAMDLHLPTKLGNMNCTFCLDCVHACPHDNISMIAVRPGSGLGFADQSSRTGRLYHRPDVAALVIMLVFAAFANAAGMVAPVIERQSTVSRALGLMSNQTAFAIYYLLALCVFPVILLSTASVISRFWAGLNVDGKTILIQFSYSLVPLGFAMWLSHYIFHGVTSYATALPATQRFLNDLGWPILGLPEWSLSCCGPAVSWLPRLEILFLDMGLLVTLHASYLIAFSLTKSPARALKAFIPWAAVSLVLFIVGIWIVQQPMDMRGTISSWN
jgi:ferredoxin